MVGLLLLVTACGGSGDPPAEPTAPPAPERPATDTPPAPVVDAASGRILYVSEAEDGPRATIARVGGTGTPFDIPGQTFPGPPDPQGSHALVVATADDDGGHREQLWLVPLVEGPPIALTPPARVVRSPAWSPDGAWLAFETDAASFRDLFRVGRTGGPPTRLTAAPHGSFEPDISPKGDRIAFGTSRDGNAEVYIMGADGADPRRLTDHPADDVRPRWSPDGTRIAWLTARGGTPRVWTMAPTGTDAGPLRTQAPEVDLDHVWAPDGRSLAVVVQTGPRDIRIDIVGSDGALRRTIDGDGVDEHPAWSPDGRRLLFTSSRAGNPDLWVIDVTTGDARQLTSGPTAEWLGRWVTPG